MLGCEKTVFITNELFVTKDEIFLTVSLRYSSYNA